MPHRGPDDPPTIDMTADGTFLASPSRWARLLALWRELPPGAGPGVVLAFACVGALAIVVFGLALIMLPAVILLGLIGVLMRGLPRRRA